jgi:hypothetical protein
LKNNTLKRVIADAAAYDNKENFRYLYDNNIEAAIKVRKSSNSAKSSNSVGCYCPRKIAVLKQLKNFEKWKHSVSYGHRWAAESVFSSIIKRMLGEYVYSRKFPNMVKEMMLKASLYNMFVSTKWKILQTSVKS